MPGLSWVHLVQAAGDQKNVLGVQYSSDFTARRACQPEVCFQVVYFFPLVLDWLIESCCEKPCSEMTFGKALDPRFF